MRLKEQQTIFFFLIDQKFLHLIVVLLKKQFLNQLQSLLTAVPGMGNVRIKRFWNQFDSINDIQKLTSTELQKKTRFPKNVCDNLVEFVNN